MQSSAPLAAFPATDPGFAALPVPDVLAAADGLVSRIRLCFGLSRDTFDAEVQPLLQRYAGYVHLLPATADNYFSSPTGLLNLGLEVAFYSLQGTDAHIFSGRSTISARRQLEPRWRLATFIGGLCCELHRVLSHLIVTDEAGGEWPQFLIPLGDWLASRSATRYFVRWRPNATESRGLGVFALPLVVPGATLQYLAQDNSVIVPHLLSSISGQPVYRDHNVLDALVRRSFALVIDRNLQANADRYGVPQFGSHLERYLVDAMRRLASGSPSWFPNREKSRAWLGPDGLFLLWPQAAHDVQALLEADQLAGIPKAPETMLDLLLEAGVFVRQPDGAPTWFVLPPELKTAAEAVKLASPAILLHGVAPPAEPLAISLVCPPGATRTTQKAPTTAPAPAVSDRHKPAIPESAYIGHLSRPPAPAGVGICRPARSRHIPASARCQPGVSKPSTLNPRGYRPRLLLGGQSGGPQKDRDVPVPTSARAAARRRHRARDRPHRAHGP